MLARIGRRDALAIAVLSLIGVGIPLWLAAAAGVIGLPTLDDWVYMRGAESLFRTGSINMPMHSAAAVGQVVLVQPLLWLSGGSPWAFTAFGLVMALIAVVATYLLARRFVETGSAVLVVLVVVAFPGFGRLEASFMTDMPAYALIMLCLLLGTIWLQGDGGRAMLATSLAAGLLAVSIREFAIAAPVAILTTGWARNRVDERLWLAAVSVAFAAGVAWIFLVAASRPDRVAPGTPDYPLSFLGPAFATLAVVLLPAVALGIGRRMPNLSPQQFIAGLCLVCLVFFLPYGAPVGNVWTSHGIGVDLLLDGLRDPVIGGPAWAMAGQLAMVAAILVAALALSWGQRTLDQTRSLSTAGALVVGIARNRQALLILFLAAYAAELILYTPFGPTLDRYLYPMVPVAAILLLRVACAVHSSRTEPADGSRRPRVACGLGLRHHYQLRRLRCGALACR